MNLFKTTGEVFKTRKDAKKKLGSNEYDRQLKAGNIICIDNDDINYLNTAHCEEDNLSKVD